MPSACHFSNRIGAPVYVHNGGVIFLARHGQTAYNRLGRFQGHLPVGLDATGRAQAAELAEAAARHGFAALWCSSLARARETAEVVAARIGLEPRADSRFAETDTGDWTDLTFDQARAADAAAFAAWARGDPAFRFPGGESFAQQGRRVTAGLAAVRTGALPALVVCHRGTIRLALGPERAAEVELPNAALVAL